MSTRENAAQTDAPRTNRRTSTSRRRPYGHGGAAAYPLLGLCFALLSLACEEGEAFDAEFDEDLEMSELLDPTSCVAGSADTSSNYSVSVYGKSVLATNSYGNSGACDDIWRYEVSNVRDKTFQLVGGWGDPLPTSANACVGARAEIHAWTYDAGWRYRGTDTCSGNWHAGTSFCEMKCSGSLTRIYHAARFDKIRVGVSAYQWDRTGNVVHKRAMATLSPIPWIHFEHRSTNPAPGILTNGVFEAGRFSQIVVSPLNTGSTAGTARIRLYWMGPVAGFAEPQIVPIVSQLAPPENSENNLHFAVPLGGGSINVAWEPPKSMFPESLGEVIHGSLFVQADSMAIAPYYSGEMTPRDSFDPNSELCAKVDVVIIPNDSGY